MRQDGGVPATENTFHCFKPNTGNTRIELDANGAGHDTARFLLRTNNAQLVNVLGDVIYAQGWKIICWQWDHPNKTAKLIMNGNVFSGTNLLMDDFDFQIPTSTYVIGTRQDEFGNLITPLTGKMGEFFYYSDVKSNAVINQLGNYLGNKYGLIWTNI